MDKWLKKDLKFIWHPYTQMKDCRKTPLILIEKAKGLKLYDDKGNFYYDTISSWWCNVHGHNHPKIKEAVRRQLNSLEHVLFAGFTHKPAILLAEKLISLSMPNLTKVFFSDNGSTAVEVALKMSFQYWRNIGINQKTKFVSLDMGYHGDTIGAMSVSGIDIFNKEFRPLFFSSLKAPSPYCYRCPMDKSRPCAQGRDKNRDKCNLDTFDGAKPRPEGRGSKAPLSINPEQTSSFSSRCVERVDCLNPLEVILKERAREISSIIIEPMLMAAGGMIVYPKEYLIKAAKLCKKFNVHLIIDEVATGFGRTGKMFASEFTGIRPDFICLSKGITAGYLPLAATLTTEKIYKAFYADYKENKTFYHGHTYTANPLSCAAALASLEIFKEEGVLECMQKIIPLFHKGLEVFRDLPLVGDVRYIGLIGALELVKDKKAKKGFDFKERIGLKIYHEGLKKNLILRPLGNIIYFFLPLCTKRNELQDILERAYSVIESLS